MRRVSASCVWFLILIHYTEPMMINRADIIDCLNGTSSFTSQIIILSNPSLIIDTRDNVLNGTSKESADAVSEPAIPGFTQRGYVCIMHIKALPGLHMMVDTAVAKCRQTECFSCYTDLTLTETTEDDSERLLLEMECLTGSAKHYVYTSPNATVQLWLAIGRGENSFEHFDIFVNLTTFPSSHRILTVNFTDAMKGFVSTPGWDGVTWYQLAMDTWVSLAIPAGHEVMLSVDQLVFDEPKCHQKEFLALHEHPDTKPFTVFCDKRSPAPVALNSTSGNVHVHFSISAISRSKGFKLNFSFHQHFSARPTHIGDGHWDCGSVANLSEFQDHFPCNYIAECVGGEDEVPCPYTSPRCGAGRVDVGGFCYIYIDASKRIGSKHHQLKWNDAEEICRQEGVQLLSFNSHREFQEVKDFRPDTPFFFRLVTTQSSTPLLYQKTRRFLDATVAHFAGGICEDDMTRICAFIYERHLFGLHCEDPSNLNIITSVLCEVPAVDTQDTPHEGTGDVDAQSRLPVKSTSQRTVYVTCPQGHVTFYFLACDSDAACWARDSVTSASCGVPVTPLPPSMTCDNGVQSVPYTLVCDRRPDCSDRSDEDFCSFAPCDMVRQFECADKSCLMTEARCNGTFECLDGSDERNCDIWDRSRSCNHPDDFPPAPAVLKFDGQGGTFMVELAANGTAANRSAVCPDTHFQCAVNDYCVPVFTRCNDVFDCPGREDEAGCDSYTCPGFYRCRGSRICLHQDDVCDNVFHCPQGDDEHVCGLACPAGCTCYGLSFFCPTALQAAVYPRLRYLDAGSSGMQLMDLESNSLLVYLRLARCGVRDWAPLSLSNLRTLDLSHNNVTIVSVHVLRQLPNLRHLALAHNPLVTFVAVTSSSAAFATVRSLDMSGVLLKDVNMFTIFPRLHLLNLTGCGLNRLDVGGFRSLGRIRVLDLRGCPLAFFPRDVFQGLDDLTAVYADNYKLCCPGSLPDGFNLLNCEAPTNEISSCESLLRSDVFRISLYAFAMLACVGNVSSLAVRVLKRKDKVMTGFDVFVATLCVSDSLMGIYLVIIGVADRVFLGTYLWEDTTWRHSTACKAAGFLSLVSNEVSAFMISLITLDRFLVLRFPFRKIRFKKSTALLASGVGWAIGLTIATVPLLPWVSDWQFYSQVAICIPLPITRQDFAGHDYAFSVMIVLNFVLFVFIAAGQGFVYMSVQTHKMPIHSPTSSALNKDRRLARRLLTVAVSDFLCWFPIGMTAILATQGFRVPGQVNVVMVVLVMPLNSAINPFLYTLNIVLEKRRLAQEQRLKQLLLSQLKSQSAHSGSSALTG